MMRMLVAIELDISIVLNQYSAISGYINGNPKLGN